MPDDAPLITFEIVTLFPEFFDEILRASLLGKAIAANLIQVHRTNLRDFGIGRHRSVDDTPYGGGPGMILRVEPVASALEAIAAVRGPSRRLLLSPQGPRFDQSKASALAALERITLICGRYEGFDERIPDRPPTNRFRAGASSTRNGPGRSTGMVTPCPRCCCRGIIASSMNGGGARP